MNAECFECRRLSVLVEMAKKPEYNGPKIPICKAHFEKRVKQIEELLKPKPFNWKFWK